MKNYIILIFAAFTVLLNTSCSKKVPRSLEKPKEVNLGVVEVADGSTNRLEIGGGRVCVIKSFTSKSIRAEDPKNNLKANQIIMIITIEEKDANGVVHILTTENLMAFSGQQVGFQEPKIAISITPRLKQ